MSPKKTDADTTSNRRELLSQSWENLFKYMNRLGENNVISETDSRGCAGVIKNLFEVIDRAEETTDERAEEALPEIDEDIIEEIIERAAKKAVASRDFSAKKKANKALRSKKPRVSPHPSPTL